MRRNHISRFTPLAFAALSAVGLLTTAIAAQRPVASTPATAASAQVEISGQAIGAAPQSRNEGDLAMDGAVAAAVIGAVAAQFGQHRVEVKLDSVAVKPASMRDRDVSGHGRILIGDEDGSDESRWIPLQFKASYDTQTGSVSHPALILGDRAASRETLLAIDAPLARALAVAVDAQFAREFQQQPAHLVIDRVTTSPAGARYLRVDALGTADFAAEGTTGAHVQALYDRRTGQWLRLAYELGTTANWADEEEAPVVAVQ